MSVTFAFTISSYRLVDFVILGLKQLRELSPTSQILVSDDKSNESTHIARAAKDHGAEYVCSRVRRSHFAGDLQSLINSLSFAKAAEADVAVKISQRLILRRKEVITALERAFSDPNICMVTPGQPLTHNGSREGQSFKNLTTLSDIVAIRVGCITPEELLLDYRSRLLKEKSPWASFIEIEVCGLHSGKFAGRSVKLPELTDNQNPDNPLILRRYQAKERQYRELAMKHGINGIYPTDSWAHLERKKYMCRPLVV